MKVKSSLNMRADGSTKSAIIGILKNGNKVTVMSKKKDWLKVKVGRMQGWISAKYVELS